MIIYFTTEVKEITASHSGQPGPTETCLCAMFLLYTIERNETTVSHLSKFQPLERSFVQ